MKSPMTVAAVHFVSFCGQRVATVHLMHKNGQVERKLMKVITVTAILGFAVLKLNAQEPMWEAQPNESLSQATVRKGLVTQLPKTVLSDATLRPTRQVARLSIYLCATSFQLSSSV